MRALCGVAVHAWQLSSHAGVKQAFDLKYPPVDNKATSGVYHCIVGTNFACSVTHETHFSCYLTCDNVGLAWSRAALPPGSATARQLGLLGRVRRVARCFAHSGAEPWPTQSPKGSLGRIALGCIAWLSAARRTRHDPLECPGLHAWPAAVWPLRRGRSCRSHRATTPHPHHAGEPSHLQVKGLALRLRPPPKAREEDLRCVLCGVGCLNIVTSENSRITNAAARNSSPGVGLRSRSLTRSL